MSNVMALVRAGVVAVAVLVAGGAGVQAQAPATQAAQEEYVPLSELPESERLPAAPFLTAAYAIAWLAIVVYVLMLWRRLGRVEQDLQAARRAAEPR